LSAQLPSISARPALRALSGMLLVVLALWMLLPQWLLSPHHVH